MAQVDNMFKRTLSDLGSAGCQSAASGSLPDAPENVLFSADCRKLQASSLRSPELRRRRFWFYPGNPRSNALFSRRWVAVESATPSRLESADHGSGAGRDTAGFPLANKAVRVR